MSNDNLYTSGSKQSIKEENNEDKIKQMVEEFNKNTDSGYTIKNVAMESDAYKEKLIIAMSSGECPDIYTNCRYQM